MTHYQTVIEEMVSQQDLASLAAAGGRCISATLNIPTPAQIRPRINHTVREVEKRLKASEIDVRTAKALLEPLHDLENTIETEGDWAISMAVYRSLDVFRCFHVPSQAKDRIAIGERFQVGPLIEAASREQMFYLLALSQKTVRLLNCRIYRFDDVDLKGRVPQNLQAFLNTRTPDHVLDSRISAGPGVGSMKGVTFGTSSDRDRHNEYLAHFFRAIDTGLHAVLAADARPMVLAGVEEELALYRKISTYPNLTEQDVYGSPDGIAPRELYRRALEMVRQRLAAPAAKVVGAFEQYQSAKRVLFDRQEILARAEEGRVSDLLLRENAEPQETAEGEDPINLAAVRTLENSGQVFSLKASEMPQQAEIAAVLRY